MIKQLIPKNKFDIETAEMLFNYTFEEIEPIIPNILEWLQDGNWPVSKPIGKFIKTLPQNKLGPYLMKIMNSEEYEWKYFLIGQYDSNDIQNMCPEFLGELKRIAENPTEIELNCELNWLVKQNIIK